jgi:thiol-disulfide isomerase/thioredoxin
VKTNPHMLCVAILATALAGTSSASAIEFQKSIEEARKLNSDGKPTVLQFGAPWCGWCRKMMLATFTDPKVDAIGKDYLWVEIDIEKQPELAARFQIDGVPHTVVLNREGRIIGTEAGFQSPEDFVKFLDESLKNPRPQEVVPDLIARFLTATEPKELRETTERLIEQLSLPTRYARSEILTAFEKKGAPVWPLMLEMLADSRLSIRASAASALRHSTKAPLPFQPFAKADDRERQISTWRKWLQSQIPNGSSRL